MLYLMPCEYMTNERNETDDSPHDSIWAPPDERALSQEILSLDYFYEALAHPRRRYLCYTLNEDTEWSLTDLATKVAAFEHDVPEHAITDSQRDQVYVSLYHTHVPKLAEEDVITFDLETETIAAAEHTDQVLTVLEGIGASLAMAQEAHGQSKIEHETS